MTRLILSLLVISLFVFSSCEDDFGKKTVSYTKATAIYGDIETLRATPIAGNARVIEDAGKIFVYDDMILVGEEGHGIHVIDNSYPSNPIPVAFLNIPGNREYFVSDGVLYAESVYDMLKIDISNMKQPVILERVENAFLATLYGESGEAIIGFDYENVTEELALDDPIFDYETYDNVYYYDVDQSLIPQSSVPASFAGNSGNAIGSVNRIVEHNGYVYAVSRGKMNVFNAQGGFEQVYSEYVGWNMETVFPMGDRLFVGTSSSVDIFNISNPESPYLQSSYFHMTSCDPVLPINETTAYVTLRTGDFSECPGDENELLVIDISHDEYVEEVQQISMNSPFGMSLIEDRLYVGEGASGVKVFDASDRRNLKLLQFDHSVDAYDVIAHPKYFNILMLAGPDGLLQYQLDGGTDLQLISNIQF